MHQIQYYAQLRNLIMQMETDLSIASLTEIERR